MTRVQTREIKSVKKSGMVDGILTDVLGISGIKVFELEDITTRKKQLYYLNKMMEQKINLDNVGRRVIIIYKGEEKTKMSNKVYYIFDIQII